MISIGMTVREMLDLYNNCDVAYSLKERLVAALEQAVSGTEEDSPATWQDGLFSFYLYDCPWDKRLDCIKAVQYANIGFGLKEAKDWIEHVDSSSCLWSKTPTLGYDVIRALYTKLQELGCDVSGMARHVP